MKHNTTPNFVSVYNIPNHVNEVCQHIIFKVVSKILTEYMIPSKICHHVEKTTWVYPYKILRDRGVRNY